MPDDPRNTLWIDADWPAPAWVKAGSSTRIGGFSTAPFTSFNLADHLGDNSHTVARNRALLQRHLQLPARPLWLRQVHGDRVIDSDNWSVDIAADASYTRQANTVCAVLTADCLPLLLCDTGGRQVAAVHLGWRGLCAGVLDNTLACLAARAEDLIAWIGPHIRVRNYEVGDEVRDACRRAITGSGCGFSPLPGGKWLASLATLVRQQLLNHSISRIYDCNRCTFDEPAHFYSYRRHARTGRSASLIWMASDTKSITPPQAAGYDLAGSNSFDHLAE